MCRSSILRSVVVQCLSGSGAKGTRLNPHGRQAKHASLCVICRDDKNTVHRPSDPDINTGCPLSRDIHPLCRLKTSPQIKLLQGFSLLFHSHVQLLSNLFEVCMITAICCMSETLRLYTIPPFSLIKLVNTGKCSSSNPNNINVLPLNTPPSTCVPVGVIKCVSESS